MAKKQPSKHAEDTAETKKKPASESVKKAAAEPTTGSVGERPEYISEKVTEPAEGAREGFGEAIKEGAEHARSAFAELIPEVGGMIHKGVYSGFYYLSYGVVFGSLMVANLLPAHSAMEEGVRDGAEAARKAFEGRHEGVHDASHTEASDEEGLTTA
ncbi:MULTISPECIES: hypothetical protein [Methylocaldum]|jgi:hypothetical protein|uniref:hypothetical protein n=1 Tax=unclassified Methylocaldum TaxID=2622260 RepID=UPI00098BC0B5|nr:hypothetical protein [Methylocaldum sp. 14B]MVF21710.1 hypothetical protein [Methylocaldum sp. BRCS4]